MSAPARDRHLAESVDSSGPSHDVRGANGRAVVLAFASGAAALVYQIVWVKQLALVVGVDMHAVTVGVSAFFGGLALGSVLLGRRADRMPHPFRLVALLEVAIAVLGPLATVALANAAAPFAAMERSVGPLAWLLPLGLVAVPAVAMGGTLPVLVRACARAGAVGRAGGTLYAANTSGAVVGALLAPFVLVPGVGVRGAALVAAALNAGAAALAAFADRASRPAPMRPRAETPSSLALVLYAAAGGVALGYEVVWSQAIVQFMSTRGFAFAVMLATYLAGLVAGAAIYARRADRVRDPWGVFALLVAAAGCVALVEIVLLGPWLVGLQAFVQEGAAAVTGSVLAGMCARFAVVAGCIVFVPTLLLGAAFPIALRLVVGDDHVGRDVGRVVAVNTAGGIAGSVLTGFVLVPALGLVRALATLAIAAAVVGLWAVVRGRGVGPAPRRATYAVAALSALVAVAAPPERLAQLLPGARRGTLAFYEESHGGTVAVVESGAGDRRFRRLYIQGVSNSGDAMPSLRYMRLQALLPLLIHRGEPRSALVIGYGTGITAGALLRVPSLERRVVAELLPAVVKAGPLFAGTYGAWGDPRLEIRLRDGRRELLASPERWDLITLEPPPPSAAGVANLYSRDFYALAASRLAPDGIVAQWLPLATQNDADTRSLVRAFLDVFPHASLWTTEVHEMLLVGSLDPIELDVSRITTRFGAPEAASALAEVGVASPAALLATWITDRRGLEAYAADAPPVTDDRPSIEYATWVQPNEIVRVLPRLLDLRTDPPLSGGDASLSAAIAGEREHLLALYAAALHAYAGDREAWGREMTRVMQHADGNPYFAWFAPSASAPERHRQP